MKNWFLYLLGFLSLLAGAGFLFYKSQVKPTHCIESVIFIRGAENSYSKTGDSCDHPKAHIVFVPGATPSTFLCKCSE